MSKLLFILSLILLILLNFSLGGKMVSHGDFFYLTDQAREMMLVKDIVQTNHLILIGSHSGIGGFFHGPLWLYLLTPFFIFSGGNPIAFLAAYIFIPLFTVIVGFFIGTLLYNKKIGYLVAFLLAISPNLWRYIQLTIGVNVQPLVFLGLFYFLIKHIRGDKYAYIFAIFFTGLSLQFETATPLILQPIILACFFLNKKIVKDIKVIGLSILSYVISLSTFILFDLKHNFLMSRSLVNTFSSGKHDPGYLNFPERIFSHFQSLINVYESVLVKKTLFSELILVAIIAYFLYRVFVKKLYKEKTIKEILLLLILPVIIFIFYLGYGYTIYIEYTLGFTIPVVIAFALIIQQIWKEKIGKILVVLFIGITLFCSGELLYSSYGVPYKADISSGSYQNQKEIASWIVNDSKGKPFGYFVYTPETYTATMDYLLWWETKSRQLPMPQSAKVSPTYLILYPPLENDKGAHAFWIKNKINTVANPIYTKEFAGGISIQKYNFDKNEKDVDPTYYQNLIFR